MELLDKIFIPKQILTAEELNELVAKINELINAANNTSTDPQDIVIETSGDFVSYGTGMYNIMQDGVWLDGYLRYAIFRTQYSTVDGEKRKISQTLVNPSDYAKYFTNYSLTTSLSVECNHKYRNEDTLQKLTCDQDGASGLTLDTELSTPTGVPTLFDVYSDPERYRDNLYTGAGEYGLTNAARLSGSFTFSADGIETIQKSYTDTAKVSLKEDHQLVGLMGVLTGVSWKDFIRDPQTYVNQIKANEKSQVIKDAVDVREAAFAEKLKWYIESFKDHNCDNPETMPTYFLNEDRIDTFIQKKIDLYKPRDLSLGDTSRYVTRIEWLVEEYYNEYVDPQGRGPWTARQPNIKDSWSSGVTTDDEWNAYYQTLYDNKQSIGERFSRYYCLDNPSSWREGNNNLFGKGPIWETVYDSSINGVRFNNTRTLNTGDIFIILKRPIYIPGNAKVFSFFLAAGQSSVQLPIEKQRVLSATESDLWVDNIATDQIPKEHLLLDDKGAKKNITIDWEQTVPTFDGGDYHRYGGSDFEIFAFRVNLPITMRDMAWHAGFGV